MEPKVIKKATISQCGMYRYRLDRDWGDSKRIVIVGLNPSTADAQIDDPTVRRCVAFAKQFGFDALTIINLFAFRATKPSVLATVTNPVGPRNNVHIRMAIEESDLVVFAWGATPLAEKRSEFLHGLVDRPACFGHTKFGAPKHPLYLPSCTQLIDYLPCKYPAFA
ncbi:hypothetical protein V22_37510 [Calycomorphotria hydatis]|uniref:DUF1643 domain-containing protein n=2 Tax=Calycomorphotria hydatis TaxID=2528027 RepID=A0A517TDN3_9PLAN|nr:hypothetical protein V22_37510 [Calycomorphotria hydatis]